ncbi:MAG: HAD family phosphatase [Erysipelotrichaceae bacterium]|nr:HAD family phosphatase [Erysipelotrichaceae bacterium]
MTTSSNKIRLVVCDIDGTLTHDGTICPSEYTLNIIERLHKEGILFGLASGRGIEQLKSLKDEWGLSFDFDMLIGLNGSEIYDHKSGRKESLYLLSKEDVKEIIEKMLSRFPDLNCSIYRDERRMIRFIDEMAVLSMKRTGMDNDVVDDLSEMWSEPCSKVMFRVSEEVMKQIEPYCVEISNERYRSCKTQTTMMEFVHRDADKGNALRRYCEENDLDINSVAAFGDMDNDNELLIAAGLGVCMINGAEGTKECADAITEKGNNEDGCAYYIEKYILNGN